MPAVICLRGRPPLVDSDGEIEPANRPRVMASIMDVQYLPQPAGSREIAPETKLRRSKAQEEIDQLELSEVILISCIPYTGIAKNKRSLLSCICSVQAPTLPNNPTLGSLPPAFIGKS